MDYRFQNIDGFIWDSGSVVTLPEFRPRAINSRGLVIGTARGRAAVWEPSGSGGMVSFLDIRGNPRSDAIAINDAGTIVGTYEVGAERRAFIATRK